MEEGITVRTVHRFTITFGRGKLILADPMRTLAEIQNAGINPSMVRDEACSKLRAALVKHGTIEVVDGNSELTYTEATQISAALSNWEEELGKSFGPTPISQPTPGLSPGVPKA